jgi:hypothetical protein
MIPHLYDLYPYQRISVKIPSQYPSIWVNYNDLTATSLELMDNKGVHPKMALFQVSELLFYPDQYPLSSILPEILA